MIHLTKYLVYSVLMLGILTQCDSVVSPSDKPESQPPTNNNNTGQTQEAGLVWDEIEGADSYRLVLTSSNNFESTVMDTTISGTSITTPPLSADESYKWKVFPNRSNDSGPWSEVWDLTVSQGNRPASVGVTLISPLDEADKVSINLQFSWQAFSGSSEYVYQLSDNSTFSSVIKEADVSGTTYKPEVLVHQKKYYWRVRTAGDTSGETWSETRSFTTGMEGSEPDPSPKVTLTAPVDKADKVSTDLEFSWESLSGTSAYKYQLSDNSSFNSVITETTVSGTTFMPDVLVPQKKYYWRVKSSGDTTGETWSDIWSFTTGKEGSGPPPPGPTPPEPDGPVTLIAPLNNADKVSTDIEFSWESLSGVSEYAYQLSDNSTFSSVITETTVSGTTYTSNSLVHQKKYYWRVKASGDTTGETWSSTWSFTTGTEGSVPPPTEPPPTDPPPTEPPTPGPSDSFVQVNNSNFVLDGNVMRFAGTNAYYLPNYEKLNPAVVDRAMNIFQDTGITVIRMWGFYDGYDCGYSQHDSSENVIQTSPGVYSESALVDLDNVIAKGKERGIGFIIPFVNYWDELGGICQYNTWAGASNPSTNMAFFLSNSDTQQWFKDYIDMLLNRVNTVTGIAYKDEPAIVAWQIMNEGRNSGADPTILRDWYQEMAQYIKSIDPNHLVSTGEEGFDEGTPSVYSVGEYSNTYALRANEGTSYVLNTAIPEIDFGSAHWYPSEFGFGSTINESLLRAQRAWLNDHQAIAESNGKPFVMGEFGFPGWGDERVSTMYNALYEHAESINLDGNLLWQLTADGTKCWEFGGNICFPGGRADTGLYNDFKNHVTNMRNLN